MYPLFQETLIKQLRDASPFFFWPNDGNLGDLLLAVSARQFFNKHNIPFQEYDPDSLPESYNLVYGGGGRFTPHWGDLESHIARLIDKRIRRCIVLPHSIYNANNLVRSLDSRHTVFCRDQKTLDYCHSLNDQALFLPGDDMGTLLDLSLFDPAPTRFTISPNANCEERVAANLWNCGFAQKLKLGVWRSTISFRIGGTVKKIAFLFRRDKEKAFSFSTPASFDLSLAWNGTCQPLPTDQAFVGAFVSSLTRTDIVVTDRLHVGIAAILANREVYLLDNDYGKISGVYHQSLQNKPNVHLVVNNQLPEELVKALDQLDSPLSKWKRKAAFITGKALSFYHKVIKI